jgi:hypothetical protein
MGQSRMDNPETLATCINLEKNEGAVKNGQSRDTDNIKYQDTGRRQTTKKHNTEN